MARTQDYNPLADINDPELMRERASDLAQQLQDIEEQQARGIVPEDYKFLGFLPMPAAMGAMLKTFVNPMLMEGALYAQKHTNTLINAHGHKLIANPAHVKIAAVGASVAVGIGTQLGEHITTFWKDLNGYKKALSKTAVDIEPVLKDIKGSRGMMGLLGISAQDNEVIYAHRRRLNGKHTADHLNNSIGMMDKIPGVISSIGNLPDVKRHTDGVAAKMGDGMKKALWGSSGALGPLVSTYQQMQRTKVARENMKPDALTMITTLQEELKADPEAREFEIPGARNQATSLSSYITLIVKNHQESMAKIDPSCSPIRKQLDKKLLEVSDRLATAIRDGEITPLMLIRLVGERHIIKRGGRDIASLKELEGVLHKFSGKAQNYQQVPEKEFYQNFTKQDLKEMLQTLKGDERLMFMSTLPDNILQAEGISDKEIHAMRETTGPKYKQMLAETVMGLASKDDKELEAMGLETTDIAQARGVAEQIVNEGKGAVERLGVSSGTTDIKGIIHQAMIGGDQKASLSELAKSGKKALAEYAAEKSQAERVRQREEGGFADRIRSRRDAEEPVERY